MVPSLESLLGPVGPDSFFGEYWEKRHLLVRREDPDHYRDFFTLDDVDAVLAAGDRVLHVPSVLLKEDGRLVAEDLFTETTSFTKSTGTTFRNGVVKSAVVLAHFQAGETVLVNALHQLNENVKALCQRLERKFALRVNANLYLSPPDAVAGGLHYDGHNVIILQVHGRKTWEVHTAAKALPVDRMERDVEDSKPLEVIELRQGDLLYLPRGVPHATHTTSDTSAHITIGVHSVERSWHALLTAALASASADDVRFREEYHAGAPDFAERFGALVASLAGCDPTALAQQLRRKAFRLKPAIVRGMLTSVARLPELVTTSTVTIADEMDCELWEESDECRLAYPANEATFHRAYLPLLRAILARDCPFKVAEVLGAGGDEVGEEAKMAVVRQLIRLGVMRISCI